MTKEKTELVAKVETKLEIAKRDITDAEEALTTVLRELNATPRAEKTTISEILQRAFTKVSAAKQELLDLEILIKK